MNVAKSIERLVTSRGVLKKLLGVILFIMIPQAENALSYGWPENTFDELLMPAARTL